MSPTEINVEELIQRAGKLPPLPQVAQKALELIRDPDTDMEAIARVLSLEPTLASLVLRWANSAYYGLNAPVVTIHQAIMFLGQNTIQSLILAASVAAYMNRVVPGYSLERGELWKHAIGVAAGARLIAQRKHKDLAEQAYHAGLLCDIGKLAFETVLRDRPMPGPADASEEKSFVDLERELFGIDHAELGGLMAQRWKLPEQLVSTITNHHRPSQVEGSLELVSIVHLADCAMMMLGVGVGKDGLKYVLDETALQVLDFQEADLEMVYQRVGPLVAEMQSFVGLA